jgi:hypothetical protein
VAIIVDYLTNDAFGFPRGRVRRVTPKVLAVVHSTSNDATPQSERDYANRAASGGPSAHLYIGRDGDGVRAVDHVKFAAWSNGDVRSPRESNAGVAYLLGLVAKGFNANEGVWLEIEHVCKPLNGQRWTDAQFATTAQQLAKESIRTGLPINTETVLPHTYINGETRTSCPFPPTYRTADLLRLISEAKTRRDLLIKPQGVPMGLALAKPVIRPGIATLAVDGGIRLGRVSDSALIDPPDGGKLVVVGTAKLVDPADPSKPKSLTTNVGDVDVFEVDYAGQRHVVLTRNVAEFTPALDALDALGLH